LSPTITDRASEGKAETGGGKAESEKRKAETGTEREPFPARSSPDCEVGGCLEEQPLGMGGRKADAHTLQSVPSTPY